MIGELRANKGVGIPDNKDSHYGGQLVRPDRKFNSLRVPKALGKALPFKSKPKHDLRKGKNALRNKTAEGALRVEGGGCLHGKGRAGRRAAWGETPPAP